MIVSIGSAEDIRNRHYVISHENGTAELIRKDVYSATSSPLDSAELLIGELCEQLKPYLENKNTTKGNLFSGELNNEKKEM